MKLILEIKNSQLEKEVRAAGIDDFTHILASALNWNENDIKITSYFHRPLNKSEAASVLFEAVAKDYRK